MDKQNSNNNESKKKILKRNHKENLELKITIMETKFY